LSRRRALTKRLLWRVYSYGILMLALSGAASFVVGTYVITPAVEVPTRPSTAWIAWHLLSRAERTEDLSSDLLDLKSRSRIEMSLFDASGRLMASNAAAPPPPLSAVEVAKLKREVTQFSKHAGVVASLRPNGEVRSYARVSYPVADLPVGTAAAQIGAALAVLGLLSIPLARSITARVEQLTRATRAFGAGDLSVRVHSTRDDEIGDLTRAFDDMAERIVQLRRSEKELLANVSHELRTPLARIRMALDLVRDGDTKRAANYMVDIEDDMEELEQLLDDVMTTARLDLARGTGGDSQTPLRRQRLEARQLLDAAFMRFARRFPERALVCKFESGLPCIDADPVLLRRALDNLLDNAVKFSNADQSIELIARSSTDGGGLLVEVRDQGMGILPADLERVFDPFFRSERSRARATGGVGLGLALAKRILEAHEGDILVDCNAETGTTFRVTVPAAHPEAA
jgi:signal transduction histidine kinase